jgi:predicted DCC family thiol-disulfide oxidoreductase YuxK
MAAAMSRFESAGGVVVLVDAACALCSRFAGFVIRRDSGGRIRFAALGSDRAASELARRGLPAPPAGTVMLVDGDRMFVRSEAVLRVLAMLPFPWSLAGWLRAIPTALRDPVYSLVARVRHRVFGTAGPCRLLTADERARFLDDDTCAADHPPDASPGSGGGGIGRKRNLSL